MTVPWFNICPVGWSLDIFKPFSAGTVFRLQNVTSLEDTCTESIAYLLWP